MREGEDQMAAVKVEVVSADDPRLGALIVKLDRELLETYSAEDIFGVDLENTEETADMVFAVAYVGEVPAGCGAIRPLDAVSVELKRFFVDPSFRQQGIASTILRFLEERAQSDGYSVLRLETGALLLEAVGLYKKFGFHVIERYGQYVDSEQSLCMEKRL